MNGAPSCSTTTIGGALSAAALACYAGIWVGQTAGWFSVDLTHIPVLGAAQAGTPKVISIIGDRQRHQAMQELTARWRERVRELYGSANLDADPQKEMMRLQYLKKLEILSDAEYEEQVFRLTQHEEQMPQRRHLN